MAYNLQFLKANTEYGVVNKVIPTTQDIDIIFNKIIFKTKGKA